MAAMTCAITLLSFSYEKYVNNTVPAVIVCARVFTPVLTYGKGKEGHPRTAQIAENRCPSLPSSIAAGRDNTTALAVTKMHESLQTIKKNYCINLIELYTVNRC